MQAKEFEEIFLDEIKKASDSSIQQLDFFEKMEEKSRELAQEREEIIRLIPTIDLTTLAGNDTKLTIQKIIRNAINPLQNLFRYPEIKCAAVCVYPARIVDSIEAMRISGASLPVASVAAGFPSGQFHLETRLREIELAIQDGAQEIDAVINRTFVLDGDWQLLLDEIQKMKMICGAKAKLKVILSIGELGNSENIYKASLAAMCAGADFIKTSTGKEAINATPEAAFVMCTAIKRYFSRTGRKVGFKAAGGIRTVEQALQYRLIVEKTLGEQWTEPALFRIGASALLEDIRSRLPDLS